MLFLISQFCYAQNSITDEISGRYYVVDIDNTNTSFHKVTLSTDSISTMFASLIIPKDNDCSGILHLEESRWYNLRLIPYFKFHCGHDYIPCSLYLQGDFIKTVCAVNIYTSPNLCGLYYRPQKELDSIINHRILNDSLGIGDFAEQFVLKMYQKDVQGLNSYVNYRAIKKSLKKEIKFIKSLPKPENKKIKNFIELFDYYYKPKNDELQIQNLSTHIMCFSESTITLRLKWEIGTKQEMMNIVIKNWQNEKIIIGLVYY